MLYKPFFISAAYCLHYLLSSDVISQLIATRKLPTDTISLMLTAYLFVWTLVAVTFSIPVLLCYFYFVPLFFIVPVLTFAATRIITNRCATTPNVRAVLKRLFSLSIISTLVFGTTLMPFYVGAQYSTTARTAAAGFVPQLQFWTSTWRNNISWPKHASPASQVALQISFTILAEYYLRIFWIRILSRHYPKGWSTGTNG
jgi:hypothetical protein